MSTEAKSIAISGDLGSGKSSVSFALANRLGIRRVGAGDLHRSIAKEMGVSTLDLNRHAEKDNAVDQRVVQMLEDIANSGERVVADARLAWHFVTESVKVHLVINPDTGAERIVRSRSDPVERYSSQNEAKKNLAERSRRERQRFKKLYGVDICRLRNYDIVIDTTAASVEETIEHVCDFIAGQENPSEGVSIQEHMVPPRLLLAPKQIYPTQQAEDWHQEHAPMKFSLSDSAGAFEPIQVGYSSPYFFVLDGHQRLSAAIKGALHHITAVLAAEDGELLDSGLTADEYFERPEVQALLREWEAIHQIKH